MTSEEVLQSVIDSLVDPISPGKFIIVQKGKWGRSKMKRLFGRQGPLGQILEEKGKDHVVVCYDSLEVLLWMVKKGKQ